MSGMDDDDSAAAQSKHYIILYWTHSPQYMVQVYPQPGVDCPNAQLNQVGQSFIRFEECHTHRLLPLLFPHPIFFD